jgi:hypothetical protein
VLNADLLRYSSRIINIRHAAATRVTFASPQPHCHADDIVSLLVQQGRSD